MIIATVIKMRRQIRGRCPEALFSINEELVI
jgi:hypothetical protein